MRDLAGRQQGRVTRRQLVAIGVPSGTVDGWVKAGYLRRVLPKVYAVGHEAPSHEANLVAAVLYAGPGAMLSHVSAAHHRGLIKYAPDVVHVSTPRSKLRPVRGAVAVHCERRCERVMHNGIPTATVPQTFLDLAAQNEVKLLRRALATLDYNKELDVDAIEQACGRGRQGSRALRAALATHRPQFAHANGELEERFLESCISWKLPVPRLNVRVHGELVDAYWPEHQLVVELDGHANHSSPAQLRRDRRRDLKLRQAGLSVVRYDWALMQSAPAAVRGDLERQLS